MNMDIYIPKRNLFIPWTQRKLKFVKNREYLKKYNSKNKSLSFPKSLKCIATCIKKFNNYKNSKNGRKKVNFVNKTFLRLAKPTKNKMWLKAMIFAYKIINHMFLQQQTNAMEVIDL